MFFIYRIEWSMGYVFCRHIRGWLAVPSFPEIKNVFLVRKVFIVKGRRRVCFVPDENIKWTAMVLNKKFK